MDLSTKVQEAVHKVEDWHLILPIVSMLFMAILNEKYAPLGISTIFTAMVLEDFLYQTVDMRLLALLTIFMLLCSNLGQFIIYFLGGWVFFQTIYLFSVTIQKQGDAEQEISDRNICPLAFLPSIGVAILIWEGMKRLLDVHVFALPLVEWQNEIVIFLLATYVLAKCYEKAVTKRAKSRAYNVFHGFGDGDVWVCAAWMAFLGVENFFVVFTLATVLQLIIYVTMLVFQKGVER